MKRKYYVVDMTINGDETWLGCVFSRTRSQAISEARQIWKSKMGYNIKIKISI